jgi:hypothetical protein
MFQASPALAAAAREYLWLLDRGYAESASLKLVGDRHALRRDERMILFRGLASSEASSRRAAIALGEPKLGDGASLENAELLVDGYNQALTVMHYLAGKLLFIGTDGLTRDAGGSYGRIPDEALFERASSILVGRLASLGGKKPRPGPIAIYLDAPVSGSRGHAALFQSLFAAEGIEAAVLLERSADAPLKAAAGGSIVATCDSAIVNALAEGRARGAGETRVYDAARGAIELAFGRGGEGGIFDLRELLASAAGSSD